MADGNGRSKKVGLARLAKAKSVSGGLNNPGSDSPCQENISSDGSGKFALHFVVRQHLFLST